MLLRPWRPEVTSVADIRRAHIEAYKSRLSTRVTVGSSRHGAKLSKVSIAGHVSALRGCFERLSEWGGDDVPVGVLVFSGDSPILNQPLPRFVDDAAAAKLLVAARAHPPRSCAWPWSSSPGPRCARASWWT